MAERKVVKDVVCPFCGTLCDDLEVVVEDGKIVEVRHACRIGAAKFLHAQEDRHTRPMIRENGDWKEVDYEDAAEETARILTEAKLPVLYGWSSTTCEAQELGVELTELVKGVIDNTAVVCHGPSILGLQDTGVPGCTLGEVKNRADTIVYWGCNPMHAHPRHMSRYTTFTRGYFRRKGREDRTIIVVDPRETATAKLADLYVQVEPHRDYELIGALRAAVHGFEIEKDEVAGVPVETVYEMADTMKEATFGCLYWGMGLTMTGARHRNIDNAICLIRDLNEYTKWVLTMMRGHYNVSGANQVFTWTTGYPYALEFTRGYPRYNPGEASATDLLMRGWCDALFVIASDPGAHFPQKAVERMAEIPVVCVDPEWTPTAELSDVYVPVAIAGVEVEGTAYRMDSVPLKLRKVVEPPEGVLSDVEFLEMVIEKVEEML